MKSEEKNKDFSVKNEIQYEEVPKIEEKKDKGIAFVVEIVKVVFLALVIIMPIRTFVFQPFFVEGSSMEPNFQDKEYLIVNELGYKKTVLAAGERELVSVDRFKDFSRGDAIVFRYPVSPDQYFIKRIVGLPGERIFIANGKVTIFNDENPKGFVLDESEYLSAQVKTGGNHEMKLKQDEFYVLGDNRSHSSDSRAWGVLSGDFIVGKVLVRAWPVNEFKIFD